MDVGIHLNAEPPPAAQAPVGARAAMEALRRPEALAAAGAALLLALLWAPEAGWLADAWRSSEQMSHGPLVPLIVGALLWRRRRALRMAGRPSVAGLACLSLSSFLYLAAVWADLDFARPFALVLMMICAGWWLGGSTLLRQIAAPLGFLVFMIPWPTTLVDRLAFPLQLSSSAYAALMAGMLGVPVQRAGVNVAVVPPSGGKPIFAIVVAQACSGLTSLLVLLALGYLVAYATPVRFGWRVLMVAAMAPLALVTNAVRLTAVLVVGAWGHPLMARWIHDHEGPVLILLCSTALMALRGSLLKWTATGDAEVPRLSPGQPLIEDGP